LRFFSKKTQKPGLGYPLGERILKYKFLGHIARHINKTLAKRKKFRYNKSNV
jgi:hypothetical protein